MNNSQQTERINTERVESKVSETLKEISEKLSNAESLKKRSFVFEFWKDEEDISKKVQEQLKLLGYTVSEIDNPLTIKISWAPVRREISNIQKERNHLDMAIQQFIGFRHAQQGYSAVQLASDMGLTKEEWVKIKDDVSLSESDKESLDNSFRT